MCVCVCVCVLGLGLGTRELQATASAAVGLGLVPGADYRGTRWAGAGGVARDTGSQPGAGGQGATLPSMEQTCQGGQRADGPRQAGEARAGFGDIPPRHGPLYVLTAHSGGPASCQRLTQDHTLRAGGPTLPAAAGLPQIR